MPRRLTKRKALEKVLNQIVGSFHPQKIILFGSRAYGSPDEDSDFDLLVIMETRERSIRKSAEISAAVDHPFPLDILVRTPEQIKQRIALGDGFIQDIMTKGIVLYEASN